MYVGNFVCLLIDVEISKLISLDVLIDNDIINCWVYCDKSDYICNGYYFISMFLLIYAVFSNLKGVFGDIMFRKIVYELLVEKGY